jgi:hypothetical protein
MLPRRVSLRPLLSFVLVMAACAGAGRPARPPPPRVSAAVQDGAFVYGLIEVPADLGATTCVAVIEAAHDRVLGGRHGCANTTPDGLFWIEDEGAIRWAVEGVQVGGTFLRLAAPMTIAGRPGALADAGVFRLARTPPAGGKPAGAALSPATGPSRADVLRKLLAQDRIAPRWKERIAAALQGAGT